MPSTALRAVFRPSRGLIRTAPVRSASTTAETASSAASKAKESASQAKETASRATAKASEGLSRVTASASSALGNAGSAASNALGKVEGRAGTLIRLVQSMIPPTVYYSRVFMELSRLMFHGQKMQPPTSAQFQAYIQPVINSLRNPSSLYAQSSKLQQYVNSARSVNREQVVNAGIIGAQLLGFFTVGEMLGRFKVVGYRYNGPPAEHH